MFTPDRSRDQSWIARVPLPWISVFVGLFCGFIAWLIIDPFQSKELGDFFQRDLESRLEIRAADTRRRFEYFLTDLDEATRKLAQNWRLVRHVYSPQWDQSREKTFVYFNQPSPWMEQGLPLRGAVEPSHVLLLDLQGNPREIYHQQDQPFPIDMALELFDDELKGITTALWQVPYFITWAEIAAGAQEKRAILMLVMPINEQFLSASQQYAGLDGIVIGLFEGDQQKLLTSSEVSQVGPATLLDDWAEDYLITSQALALYLAPQSNLQFFTFISRSRLTAKLEHILASVRQQRFFEALVYVAAFTITLFLISSRLSHILQRISTFGHNALGIEQQSPGHGNQLLLLENRLQELFQQVSYVKDETKVAQEHRIRESEALKSALLENSLDPIITVDKKGLIVEANATAQESFGYHREQLLGNPIDLLVIHPKDHLQIREMLARCRQKGTLQKLCQAQKMLSIDAFGGEKPVECSVMPIQLKERMVFTIYLRDISEREEAEKRIQSLAKFTSENPSPVLRVNDRGVIIYANSASTPLLDYWGCDRGQTLPLYWRNLIFDALQDGENREYEINLEEQIYSLLMVPVLELDYANLYGRDITQVRTAEQQSRQHQSELVHVCRLSTMGEMATGLAHELNQPLSAIVNFASGCVRRLQTGMGGEAELVDAMAQITVQAERAGEIIKRLRALVGKRAQEHSVVNLNHLVLEVASFVEYVAEKHHVDVTLRLSQGPLPAELDLVQIEQVLLNLVRNAIDAMKHVDIDRRKLELVTRKLGEDQVEVLVKDTGPGIPPENIEHLFDAFFSTKESGMGMGLPISRKIIESHHGQISATSEIGKGAEFRVVLPSDPNLELAGF
ncbi:MAG: PAS domain S-box protein [Gammaproteobacteria bacterium]|nr:PAS domain S-box protein [Gammaproteobacteria bacterium]